jgi:hypothetical protein
MALEEIIISHYADPDFGVLRLIETRTEGRVNGGPWKPLVCRESSGARQDVAAMISISSSDDPPTVPDDVRVAFRGIVLNLAEFKRTVAESQLELAQDWAMQGGRDGPLNADLLANAVALTGFRIDSDRLTVFLEDTESIFDGHAIEVRIRNGSIVEIGLAG